MGLPKLPGVHETQRGDLGRAGSGSSRPWMETLIQLFVWDHVQIASPLWDCFLICKRRKITLFRFFFLLEESTDFWCVARAPPQLPCPVPSLSDIKQTASSGLTVSSVAATLFLRSG